MRETFFVAVDLTPFEASHVYVPFWLLLTDDMTSTPLVLVKTLFAGPFQVIVGEGLAAVTEQVKEAL